jgi:hypothetical protein
MSPLLLNNNSNNNNNLIDDSMLGDNPTRVSVVDFKQTLKLSKIIAEIDNSVNKRERDVM